MKWLLNKLNKKSDKEEIQILKNILYNCKVYFLNLFLNFIQNRKYREI